MSKNDGLNRREIIAAGLGGLFMLTTEETSAQTTQNLTFWTVRLNTPELGRHEAAYLAEFEKENPGIKIKHEPVSGKLVYPKFLAAIRGQSMPDVAEAYTYHPLQFAAVDQMEPMDDIIDEWKKSGRYDDIVNEYAYKKFYWNDHYWGVPYNLDIRPDLLSPGPARGEGHHAAEDLGRVPGGGHRAERPGERGLRRRLSGRQLPHRPALLHVVHVPGRRQHPRQGRQPDLRHDGEGRQHHARSPTSPTSRPSTR